MARMREEARRRALHEERDTMQLEPQVSPGVDITRIFRQGEEDHRVVGEEDRELQSLRCQQQSRGRGLQSQGKSCQASPENHLGATEALLQAPIFDDDATITSPGAPGQRRVGRRGGRGRGRGRGGRAGGCGGRGGGRVGRPGRGGESTADVHPAPAGWVQPNISVDRGSPVLLRPRSISAGAPDFSLPRGTYSADLNFVTPPPPRRVQRREDGEISQVQTLPARGIMSGICRFSLTDFTPGAPPVSTEQRQSVGEYHAHLHDCGEHACPFTERGLTARRNVFMAGHPVAAGLSPGDHLRVDPRAHPREQFVKVKLDVLGYDQTLWGDLETFRGQVLNRYYHEVHGQPMFSVDFGGCIGVREVLVFDTEDATRRDGTASRVLDFGVGPSQSQPASLQPTSSITMDTFAHGDQAVINEDEPSDGEWVATWEDFCDMSEPGNSPPHSPSGSFEEVPLQQLGVYNEEEDRSAWSFAKLWADDQWQEKNLTLCGERIFTGPKPGPATERAVPGKPMDYFRAFWPDDTLDEIVWETNRYAEQIDYDEPHLTNGRAQWIPIDKEELLCWFGILILMGLKKLPHRRMYWDSRPFYGCPIISAAMTRQRFEDIVRCVHLVDNECLPSDPKDPAFDKIGKVRWLIEKFARISQELYNPERVMTVDEIMVQYKGHYCEIQQYMKSKPVRFGLKIWALASSSSRYVQNCIVYLGTGSERVEGDLVGEDATLQVVKGYENRGHTIVTDNFFTGVKLHMSLLDRGFFATGTTKKTSKGFPASLAGFPKTQLPPRGTIVVKMHRSRKIVAICWVDSKPVFLLSTATNPCDPTCVAPRWVRGKRRRVDFPTSPILLEYQQFMRGIDVVDQQRKEYTAQLDSHCWWHRAFLFIFDSSILNSFILYLEDCETIGFPVHARQLWYYDLAMRLVGPYLPGGFIRGRHRHLAPPGFHRIEGHPSCRRVCIVCKSVTRRFCGGCGGQFMCDGQCYVRVHTQPGFLALAARR